MGRKQYVLDLSRKSVVDYLFDAISCVLNRYIVKLHLCIFKRANYYDIKFSANIEFLKWDMNRPLTEVFSQRNNDEMCSSFAAELGVCTPSSRNQTEEFEHSIPKIYQSETSHRYVIGLYELQDRIRKAHPSVIIENSASGGRYLYLKC